MRWLLRVMKDDPSGEVSLFLRDEVGREYAEGGLRTAARAAAQLAERHSLMVLGYIDRGYDPANDDWMLSCQPRGDGRFWWTGTDDVVAICRDRHGGWRDDFPLEGGGS